MPKSFGYFSGAPLYGVPCGSAVLTPPRKALLIFSPKSCPPSATGLGSFGPNAQKLRVLFGGPALRCSVRLRRTHTSEKGIVNIFPKKLPPFLLRRGCGGQVGLVIHSACATDDTFRGPRSQKRPCPTLRIVPVSEDRARHCVSCSSQKTVPDTACRARLRRPCPTLRVVLVSCVPCGSAVLAPPRKALLMFRWH